MNWGTGPAPQRRWSQKGVPPGWLRIAADQIKHKSEKLRIVKGTFAASGGGKYYTIWYKDKKGTWCRYNQTILQELQPTIEIAEGYL